MNKQTKFTILISLVLLTSSISSISTLGDSHSIIELKIESENFYPTFIDNNSYYIINPGDQLNGISYFGESTDFEYSDASLNGLSMSSYTVNDGESVSLLFSASGDSVNIQNPFFGDVYFPRVGRYENFDPLENYLQGTTTYPISLHNDYSYSFFGEAGETYTGYTSYENPFLLDVTYSNVNSAYSISFINANAPISGYIDCWEKTLPVIPTGDIQYFSVTIYNQDTVFTLTPHNMPTKSATNINVNSTYEGIIEQGTPPAPNALEYDYEDYIENNEVFGVRYFSFDMEEGKDYFIDLNIYPLLECAVDCEFCCSLITCVEPEIHSFPLQDKIIAKELTYDEGTGIAHAFTDTTLEIVLYSTGFLYHKYHFLYKQIESEVNYDITPLGLNKPLSLEEGMYSLRLLTDTMMALNRSVVPSNEGYTLDFYTMDNQGNLDYITYSDYFGGGFTQEEANLIGDSASDLGTNWVYVPAGTYVIAVDEAGTGEIQFNTIPVQTMGSSMSVTADRGEIMAFGISPDMAHLYDLYVINTDINQSVTYSYSYISKYQMYYANSAGNLVLGDPDLGVSANVTFDNIFITSNYANRILMLYPYSALNSTSDPIDVFETDYQVLLELNEEYNSITYRNQDGSYIFTEPMTNSLTIPVNDEISADNDQFFGIPIYQEANNLYNVTISLIGNYTASDYNMTLDNTPLVTGSLVGGLSVFDDLINASSWDGRTTYSFVYLQVKTISYLFIDIVRDLYNTDYLNGSIEVAVSKIAVGNLSLSLPDINDLSWDEDRVNGEYKNSDKLLRDASPSSTSDDTPLGFLSFGIGMGIVILTLTIRRRKR